MAQRCFTVPLAALLLQLAHCTPAPGASSPPAVPESPAPAPTALVAGPAGLAPVDEVLRHRSGYAHELNPRRCDPSLNLNVPCVWVDVPPAATLRVTLQRRADGPVGCRPVGKVNVERQGQRVILDLNQVFSPTHGLCRHMAVLSASVDIGPFGPGAVELVAKNADIVGVTLAPATVSE